MVKLGENQSNEGDQRSEDEDWRQLGDVLPLDSPSLPPQHQRKEGGKRDDRRLKEDGRQKQQANRDPQAGLFGWLDDKAVRRGRMNLLQFQVAEQ